MISLKPHSVDDTVQTHTSRKIQHSFSPSRAGAKNTVIHSAIEARMLAFLAQLTSSIEPALGGQSACF